MYLRIKKYSYLFYLILSLLGGFYAFYYSILGIIYHQGNFNSLEFIQSTWINNYYAKSITFDFWTGVIAGTFFILKEGIRLEIKRVWLFILMTFFIGFAFGFPLFLFYRELKLKKISNNKI
ncbi:MAG: DUF2834 domain-containing protein [Flavobacteriia bacterium]|nr:DUF2834 domain-containing protein [Flavobacteriia bacterium]